MGAHMKGLRLIILASMASILIGLSFSAMAQQPDQKPTKPVLKVDKKSNQQPTTGSLPQGNATQQHQFKKQDTLSKGSPSQGAVTQQHELNKEKKGNPTHAPQGNALEAPAGQERPRPDVGSIVNGVLRAIGQ
jgi:hypothetical protein